MRWALSCHRYLQNEFHAASGVAQSISDFISSDSSVAQGLPHLNFNRHGFRRMHIAAFVEIRSVLLKRVEREFGLLQPAMSILVVASVATVVAFFFHLMETNSLTANEQTAVYVLTDTASSNLFLAAVFFSPGLGYLYQAAVINDAIDGHARHFAETAERAKNSRLESNSHLELDTSATAELSQLVASVSTTLLSDKESGQGLRLCGIRVTFVLVKGLYTLVFTAAGTSTFVVVSQYFNAAS